MKEKLENLIPIIIRDKSDPWISARDLHGFLGIKTNFRLWYPKIIDYGFLEDEDYKKVYERNISLDGENTVVDYMITLSMAKEISLIQHSKRGKEARAYFINLEKKFKHIERALESLDEARAKSSDADKSTYENTTNYTGQSRKSVYENVTENINTLRSNFRDTSKLFGIRENLFVNWLLLNNYCYRDKQGNIKPYAKAMDYFYMKEFTVESGYSGIQTMINAKGREFFRRILTEENIIKLLE